MTRVNRFPVLQFRTRGWSDVDALTYSGLPLCDGTTDRSEPVGIDNSGQREPY